jgi:hypothetical protein
MKRFLICCVLPLLFVAQPSASRAPISAARADTAEEEFAVYAATIDSLYSDGVAAFAGNAKVALIVIKDHTVADQHFPGLFDNSQYIRQELPSLSDATLSDYKQKNKEQSSLKDSFKLKIKHVLIDEEEIKRAIKDAGWKSFYEKYPESGGLVSFSRVGFNAATNQALVYFEHWCGGLCGSGNYILLRKEGEGWKVVSVSRAWNS